MLQSTTRLTTRRLLTSTRAIPSTRRFLSSTPASRARGWRSSALRWGLAAAGVYYYNTSSVFAEETDAAIDRLTASLDHIQESKLPTVDAIVEERQRGRREQAEAEALRSALEQSQRQANEQEQEQEESRGASSMQAPPSDRVAQEDQAATAAAAEEGAEASMGGLEEEADQQGAFNPETGEINWDCSCLGGMAHGVCGEDFRAAFSCFVYSNEEPKGMDCIEKFKGMQDCFRAHPDVYGAELEDEEEEIDEELRAQGLSREQVTEKPQPLVESSREAEAEDPKSKPS